MIIIGASKDDIQQLATGAINTELQAINAELQAIRTGLAMLNDRTETAEAAAIETGVPSSAGGEGIVQRASSPPKVRGMAQDEGDSVDADGGEAVEDSYVRTISSGPFSGVDLVVRRGSPPTEMDKLVNLSSSIAPEADKLPSATADVATIGDVIVGAVAVRGLGHQDSPKTVQDYAYFKRSADARHIVCVISDGVSASKLSHRGAARAAVTCATIVAEQLGTDSALDRIVWEDVLDRVKDDFRRLPDSADDQSLSDEAIARVYGATAEVLVVATSADLDGTIPFVRATLSGDGACYVFGDGEPRALGTTKGTKNGLASNEVTPLPTDGGELYPIVQHGHLAVGQAVMITSDGIGDDMRRRNPNVARYIQSRWARPVPAHELLRVASYLAYQSFDDRSAVIVWS